MYRNKDIIGNTNTEILKNLYEDENISNIGKNSITITNSVFIANSKIVGFVYEGGQGYNLYEKNKKGDYILIDSMIEGTSSNSKGVTSFLISYNLSNGIENSKKAYIVISDGSEVSDIEVSINNEVYNKEISLKTPSTTLIKDNI